MKKNLKIVGLVLVIAALIIVFLGKGNIVRTKSRSGSQSEYSSFTEVQTVHYSETSKPTYVYTGYAGPEETKAKQESTSVSAAETKAETTRQEKRDFSEATYVLNTNTKRFHYPTCDSVTEMREWNRQPFYGTREEAINQGYIPCNNCKP